MRPVPRTPVVPASGSPPDTAAASSARRQLQPLTTPRSHGWAVAVPEGRPWGAPALGLHERTHLPFYDPPGDGRLPVVARSELERGGARADVGDDQVGRGARQLWREEGEERQRREFSHA